MHGAETWTLWKVDQNYMESFKCQCWRRMEKIGWTDRVRNEEVLHRVNWEGNVLHTVKRRKANFSDHILRRNCLIKHVSEGKTERRINVTGTRRRIHKQLLDDFKEKIGY